MPGRHRNIGAVYTPIDPFYTHQQLLYQKEDSYNEDIAALELTGRHAAKARSLKIARELVKISTMAYTYNANKEGEIMDEYIDHPEFDQER